MDGAEDAKVERGKAKDVDGAEYDEDEHGKETMWMEPKILKWKEIKRET